MYFTLERDQLTEVQGNRFDNMKLIVLIYFMNFTENTCEYGNIRKARCQVGHIDDALSTLNTDQICK